MTYQILNNKDRSRLSRHVMNLCGEGIIVTDANAKIIEVNPAMCEITGYSREHIIGNTPSIFKSGLHDKQFYKKMWLSLKKNGSLQGEIWDRKKTGEVEPRFLRIKTIYDEHGDIVNYVGMMQDNSKLLALSELANNDPLTGLANRRLFDERLQQSVVRSKRTGKSFALLYIDLDEFKKINDTRGHLVGDKVLQCVSTRLSKIIREEDTVARLGGDEFAIILPDVSLSDDVKRVCEKIKAELRSSHIDNCETYNVGSSIGYSIYPEQADSIPQLLLRADQAMFFSKKRARDENTSIN